MTSTINLMTLLLISQAKARAEQTWTLMDTVKDPGDNELIDL